MSGARRSGRPVASGVLLLDKPAGITSHDAVAAVRRAFGQREVGHTGTLDPMATGLLVVMLGRATRLARFVEASEKRYRATVSLGRSTSTYDAEGATEETASVPHFSLERLRAALDGLTGELLQQVPAFSAVKVNGERLYARARRGEAVEAPVRTVTVHRLELLGARPEEHPTEVDLDLRVSKGTYVRSLAVQLGAALGVPAHLSALRRTEVGAFSVAEAVALDDLERAAAEPGRLRPLEAAVAHLPRWELTAALADAVRHGRELDSAALGPVLKTSRDFAGGEPVALFAPGGDLLGVAEAEGPREALLQGPARGRAARYACVLADGGRG